MQEPIKLSEKRKKNLNFLPTSPGVYRFLNSQKKVLYIGKAKDLRKRVKSYFSKSKNKTKKISSLNFESLYIEITITNSELEALLLEQHLIKELKPKYNVQFKDDKGFPWIKVSTSNEYPSATSFLGKINSKDKYFGPFPSSSSVKDTLKTIQKIFKVRDCKDAFFKNRKRPCLQHEIGRCSAPCVRQISKKDYRQDVQQVCSLLEGKANDVLETLYSEMDKNSSKRLYEKAADCRNKISSLREVQREQSISGHKKDKDAISILYSNKDIKIGVTSVRGGWIISHKNFTENRSDLKEGLLDSFISSYYSNVRFCPSRILVTESLFDKETIQSALSKYHSKKILITSNIKNKDVGLMNICKTNTQLNLRRKKKNINDISKTLESLKDKLKMKESIEFIESYDISHLSGQNAVGGKVVYDPKGKVRDLYRIYNISKDSSGNDLLSMEEVIKRRLSNKDSNLKIPSLILIDGGKLHLKAIRKVINEKKIKGISLIAISKGARRKREMDIIHTEKTGKLRLKGNSQEYLLIQEIRDETHRFSISRLRKRELKSATKSSLDSIDSVGTERKKALLRFFGSLEQITKASSKDLMKVKGIGKKTANIIYRNLH